LAPLRIHTDEALAARHQPVAMLSPFFAPEAALADAWHRWDDYATVARDLFELAPLATADASIFPLPWEVAKEDPGLAAAASRFVAEATSAGKPVIVFFFSDSDEEVPLRGATIYRTSLSRSRLRPGERAMPSFAADVLRETDATARPWRAKPSVGFCGYVPADRSLVRRTVRRLSRGRSPWTARREAVAALGRTTLISANVIVHHDAFLISPTADSIRRDRRRTFIANLVESD
jgi:hypothetical protein